MQSTYVRARTDENVAVLFDNDEFFEIVDDCDQGVTEKLCEKAQEKGSWKYVYLKHFFFICNS